MSRRSRPAAAAAAAAAAALAATFAPCVREITSQRWNLRVFSTVSERALSAIVLTVLPPQANLWS